MNSATRSKKTKIFFLWLNLACASLGFVSTNALAQYSHSSINTMRSSSQNFFFQQSLDAELGRYRIRRGANPEVTDTHPESLSSTQKWKGYSLGTTVGTELFKFVQFTLGHNLVKMRSQTAANETLEGSRLAGGLRLAFTAPLFNLELGSGFTGAKFDYSQQLERTSLYGSGHYYSLGMNYFLKSFFSIYFETKIANEHYTRDSGSEVIKTLDADSNLFGLGFRLWL